MQINNEIGDTTVNLYGKKGVKKSCPKCLYTVYLCPDVDHECPICHTKMQFGELPFKDLAKKVLPGEPSMSFKITTEEELREILKKDGQRRDAIFRGEIKVPANDAEAARKHHEQYGDMYEGTCLLAECALHYPETKPPEPPKNDPISGRIRGLIENLP